MAAAFIKDCMEVFNTSDLFLILGFTKDRETVSEAEIKNAHKRLLLIWHPDKNSTKSKQELAVATQKFVILHKAYNILSDPEKKEIYLSNELYDEWFNATDNGGSEEPATGNDEAQESDDVYADMPNLNREEEIVTEENSEDDVDETEDINVGKQYEVEKIVGKRTHKGKLQYRIKWKGYSTKDNTWEDDDNCDCPDAIEKFEKRKKKPNGKSKPKNGSTKKPAKTDGKRDRKRKAATEHPQSKKKAQSSKYFNGTRLNSAIMLTWPRNRNSIANEAHRIFIKNLSEENVSISSLCENINSFEIINNENVVTPLNEFSKIPETSVPDFNNPLKVNKIGQMPFCTEVQSKNDSVDDETAAENSDNSENFVL